MFATNGSQISSVTIQVKGQADDVTNHLKEAEVLNADVENLKTGIRMLPQNQKITKRKRKFGKFETREQQKLKMLAGSEVMRSEEEKEEHNEMIIEINSKIKRDNILQMMNTIVETGKDDLQKGHTAEMTTHDAESDC